MSDQITQCAFKESIVEAALDRWKASSGERSKIQTALKKGEYDKVESPERMAKRVNRVLKTLESQLGTEALKNMSTGVQEAISTGEIATNDVTNILFERVIGETRDLLQIDFFGRGKTASRSIGRIVTPMGANRVSYGTGFLIAPGIMMTNWHVFETAEIASRSKLELDYQANLTVQTFALDTEKLFLNDEDLDFAIVAVKPVSDTNIQLSEYGWCPLDGTEGKISIGEPVNIIQHPLGEKKQVAFRDNQLLDLDKKAKNFAYYRADTEQGSSGSPAFNDQWEVVALHHSGVPKTNAKGEWLKKDGSPFKKGDDAKLIDWIANEGIRVSAVINHLKSLKLSEPESKLVAQIIAAPKPAQEKVPISNSPPTFKESAKTLDVQNPTLPKVAPVISLQHIFNFYGTTNVFVSPPGATAPAESTPELRNTAKSSFLKGGAAGAQNFALEKVEPDPDYSNRPGYDPDFLGFSVPLPQPVGEWRAKALPITGADPANPFELKYYRYSVIMNKERKLAFISAANYDPLAPVNHPRDKDGDKWYFDPRIGEEFQLGEKLYSGNPLDRGHLTRRNDTAWGDTKDEAKRCNDDTFHFSNCSPQHEIFNQSGLATQAGLLLWGNLENHISKQGKDNARRLSIFNGPILRDDDRVYRKMAQLPKEFWKIAIFADDDGNPRAAAFKLSQASLITTTKLKEKIEFADYEVYQVALSELALDTGLDFGDLVHRDTKPAFESLKEAKSDPKPLGRLEDAIL